MGTHDVYLDREKGLLADGKVATIDDDGTVRVPDTWFSDKVVAHIREDGIYVEGPGPLLKRRIARIDNGRVYSVVDEGWLTYGKLIGSVDEDGTIRDARDRRVGEISGGSPLKKGQDAGTTPAPSGGLFIVALAPIAALTIPVMSQIAWASNMSVFSNPVSALCGILFLICGVIVGTRLVENDDVKASFSSVLFASMGAYLVPTVLFVLLIIMLDNPIPAMLDSYGGLYGGLLLIVGFGIVIPLFCLVVGGPILIAQTLVTVSLKRSRSR